MVRLAGMCHDIKTDILSNYNALYYGWVSEVVMFKIVPIVPTIATLQKDMKVNMKMFLECQL